MNEQKSRKIEFERAERRKFSNTIGQEDRHSNGKKTDIQIDRKTVVQTDRKADAQVDKKTGTQTDIKTGGRAYGQV